MESVYKRLQEAEEKIEELSLQKHDVQQAKIDLEACFEELQVCFEEKQRIIENLRKENNKHWLGIVCVGVVLCSVLVSLILRSF